MKVLALFCNIRERYLPPALLVMEDSTHHGYRKVVASQGTQAIFQSRLLKYILLLPCSFLDTYQLEWGSNYLIALESSGNELKSQLGLLPFGVRAERSVFRSLAFGPHPN